MENMDYAIVGFLILLFIFELIIIWYQYWTFNELNKNDDDINDMIVDLYYLEVAIAAKQGIETTARIPKRAKETYNKRRKDKHHHHEDDL